MASSGSAKGSDLHLSEPAIRSETDLVLLAVALGAVDAGGPLSLAEQRLVDGASALSPFDSEVINDLRAAIRAGQDPLGDLFCRLRPGEQRREAGAFYTPEAIVSPMVDWTLRQEPHRVIDAGSGSGRFVAAIARIDPGMEIVAIDLDPLATLLTRAALGVLGAVNCRVIQADYTTVRLPRGSGKSAFIGNPPYVRHHTLSPKAKKWVTATSERLGHRVSALAGLHAHFFVATAVHGRPGDVGCFVTSSEWLDVGYGSIIRHLLLNGLGGRSVHVVDPRAAAFADAQTTAVITCFEVGAVPERMVARFMRTTEDLSDLDDGEPISRIALDRARAWSPLIRSAGGPQAAESGVQLGTLVRVSRGHATGANDFFVLTRDRAKELGIAEWCRPAITAGRQILASGGVVRDQPDRKLLLLVPVDVDRAEHPELDAYLRSGERRGPEGKAVSKRYLCSHRRPWWVLGDKGSPPIVASYMARQAPMFALNPDGLAIINIAHGLYPLTTMTDDELRQLVDRLNGQRESFLGQGRTYQGGLQKFEPRDMEHLLLSLPA